MRGGEVARCGASAVTPVESRKRFVSTFTRVTRAVGSESPVRGFGLNLRKFAHGTFKCLGTDCACVFDPPFGVGMSTISFVNNPVTGYISPISVDSPTASSGFNQSLAAAKAPKTWLTTHETSQASRPNVKEFMDLTGAQFLDASELIYGVVGSNTDVRDWTAIMANVDPISAARHATGQMYGRTDTTPRTDATYLGISDTVAKEGNFAVRLLKDDDDKVVDQGLKLIDAQGLLLRDAGGNPETIARNAWLFGFDTQPLAKLASACATVSADLGRAVQQASTMAHTDTATIQMPVLTMAEENAGLIGLSELAMPPAAPAKAELVVTIQKDDQASSPSLEQLLQEATASAFEYVDSTS